MTGSTLTPGARQQRVTLEDYQRDFLATYGPWALRRAAAALRGTGGGDHSEGEKAESLRRAVAYLRGENP